MATLRPCKTGFDRKIKAKIVSNVFEKSPHTAKFINQHFQLLSWIFTLLFFASFVYVLYGAYNLIIIGTCNPQHPESCIFTPKTNVTTDLPPHTCTITADFAQFYGATCQHCKSMEPIVKQVEEETGIQFEKVEVWENNQNAQLMLLYKNEILNDCKLDAEKRQVPVFLSVKHRKAVCGKMTKEQLKQFVLENQ